MALRKNSELGWVGWQKPLIATSAVSTAGLDAEAASAPALIYGANEISTAGAAYHAAKRVIDIMASALGILALLPFMSVVAMTIKLTSPGPVFFRQTRIGRHGIPFTFYKFRSMRMGSDREKEKLLDRNLAEYPLFKMRDDPRVTPFGRAIRRLGVDELPQLWNVLKGDMSLVGPRPHLPEEVREYRPWHWARLEVMPGITCLWQVRARKRLSFNEWIESDLEYVRQQSLWLDLSVLARTMVVLTSSDRIF